MHNVTNKCFTHWSPFNEPKFAKFCQKFPDTGNRKKLDCSLTYPSVSNYRLFQKATHMHVNDDFMTACIMFILTSEMFLYETSTGFQVHLQYVPHQFTSSFKGYAATLKRTF